jgi:ABC transporter ATM
MIIQIRLCARVRVPRTMPLPSASHIRLNRVSYRSFAHAARMRYKNASAESKPLIHDPLSTGSLESLQSQANLDVPSSKSNGAPRAPDLLIEQTVSNKEQRKADWAIMKEMSRYLWPKVWEARDLMISLCLTKH